MPEDAVTELCIDFGALAYPLSDQIKPHCMSAEKLEHFQRDADAIVRLCVRGLLIDSAAHICRKKLMRRITQELESADA